MATLVAGGAGFIGSFLCDGLIQRCQAAICADNLITGRSDNISHLMGEQGFTYLQMDVTRPLPELPPVDRIYHLASPASPLAYQRHPVETMQANAEGTRRLLELARQQGARFLFASTSEIYGDPLVHPQPESYLGNTSCTGPRSMYDESKRYGEALTMAYRSAYSVETRIVRIFNTYGPRMAVDDGRVVSNFIVQALRGEPLTIYGDGRQTRSFQYVSDLIDGLIQLMESSYPEPVNIGNPGEFTMRELAELVLELTRSRSSIEYQDLPGDDPRQRCPDICLARSILAWEPTMPLREGLELTISHFRDRLGMRPNGRVPGMHRPEPSFDGAIGGH